MRWLPIFIFTQLTNDRDRWVLWLPVLIGCGVGSYFALRFEPSLWIGIAALIITGAGLYWLRQNHAALCCVIALFVVALGFTAAKLRTLSVAHIVLHERVGPASISGRILLVEDFDKGPRITLENVRVSALETFRTPKISRITLRGDQPNMKPGQWIRVRAVLTPPPAPVMPGSFDFQRRFYFQEIGATGFGLGPVKIENGISAGAADVGLFMALNLYVSDLRHRVAQSIREVIPGAVGGVAAALMTGDRSGIPKDVLEAFRRSGLAHLLAISGLHIGLIAGLLFGGSRAFFALIPMIALTQPIKKWAAIIAISGAFSYAVMAGATIPTQRAFLMIGLVLAAVIFDREGVSMRLVAWAAAIILVLRPEALMGASFQLSFAAVIALIAAYEYIRERDISPEHATFWRRPLRYLGGVALTTIIATLATSPFAIFHFNQMAQFGLIANIIAVPLTAIWVMPLAIVSFILMPFGLSELGLVPMGWGVGQIIETAQGIAAWDGAVLTVPAFPEIALVVISFGGLWLCLWRQKWRLAGVGLIAIGFSTLLFANSPDIVVDEKGKLFAVKGADGILHLSSKRVSKFSAGIWLRRVGQPINLKQDWPREGFSKDKSLSCDQLGCIYRQKGHRIALVTDAQAVPEDCRTADIVVSAVPVPWYCPSAKVVIDWFDLWRNGAHAIWLSSSGVKVENVNTERGRRPWVLRRDTRPQN